MRILLLGAGGQLGKALLSVLWREYPYWEVIALGRDECDITKPRTLVLALRHHNPDVIINGAAYTAVDHAESEPDLADSVNHRAVMELAREAQALGALLVHFSTDYVFDGSGTRPWTEVDQPRPLNVYGASKYAGEQAIRELCPHHLILRTSWLYGGGGAHFARTVLHRAKEGLPLRVVADQWGAQTQVGWLAKMSLMALSQVLHSPTKAGLYHLSNQGETSWHGFALALVEEAHRLGLLAQPVTVHPILSEQWSQQAHRPLNSRLDCRLFSTVFGITPSPWREEMIIWLTSQSSAPAAPDTCPFP